MEDAFDICWAAHGPMEVEKEQIRRLIEAAGMIMDGKVEGKEPPMPIPAKEYAWSGAAFFCSATQL